MELGITIPNKYMGRGTARGGHLSCKQKISWIRFPGAPLIIRLGEAFEFTVLSGPIV